MKATMILADPAWAYNDRRAVRKDGKQASFGIGASTRYRTESAERMATIPVADLASDRCHLYMWATWPMLPDALYLMDAWGFEYSTRAFVWIKTNPGRWAWPIRKLAAKLLELNNIEQFVDWLAFFGVGFYTASNTEFVLLGTKGQPFKPIERVSELIIAPRSTHSRKPDAAHERITQMYPGHAYAELFARRYYPGWACFGNEIDGMDMRESIPLYLAGAFSARPRQEN